MRKRLDIKCIVIALLTVYAIAITGLYVWTSIRYKDVLADLTAELKELNRENAMLPAEMSIAKLESQRQEILEEIRAIKESK